MTNEIGPIDAGSVKVGDAQIAYEAYGVGDTDKRSLVFLHGYSIQSTGAIYRPLFAELLADFNIYAVDMRGHGNSSAYFEGWSFRKVADDIAALVDGLSLKDPVHAGHSFGGFMGMLTQIQHPQTFSALCLLASSAASGGVATPKEVETTFVNEGRNKAVLRPFFEAMYLKPIATEEYDPLVDSATLLDPSMHAAYFGRDYPSIVITDQLSAIDVPVLMLNGTQDTVVSPVEQHHTAAGLPRCKEINFSDEGHMLPLESPVRTAREIRYFCTHDVGLN